MEIDFLWLMLNGAGSLAMQLVGISMLSGSLKSAMGGGLAGAIRASCGSPWLGFVTGAGATAALTSATATSLMTVEFLEAGAMPFGDSLAVALGINVGSTAAPLISRVVPVARFGLGLVGLAFFARSVLRKPVTGVSGPAYHWLTSAMGLGLLLHGMHSLSSTVRPLRAYEPLRDVLASMAGSPVPGAAAGAVLAVVLQSSTATIAIAAELAAAGTMPVPVAVAIVIGSNVGTCATTLVSAAGQSAAAWRFAVAYLAYKLAAAIALLLAFPLFVAASGHVAVLVTGSAGPAVVCTLSHVLFNALLGLVALPFTEVMASLVRAAVPGTGDPARPKGD